MFHQNRWVLLAKHFPWKECVRIFVKQFFDVGRKAINPTIVIGRLIIEHKLNLSDEETVLLIRENRLMEFFLAQLAQKTRF